ncbi:MAG: HDIG domain-containing protein [Prevotellaceae bacterium]|jgi:uncharacterized protein|nr:HDIG domain-containing protein [Prevotellaceae bacterium]
MNPLAIIEKYYSKNSRVYAILVEHSRSVAHKALQLANLHPELAIDKQFVEEAAMLHDIGIFRCYAPKIDCYGEFPYICHGYLGADLLRAEGLPKHALVCERHTGTGLSLKQIIDEKLPLPHRDMCPVSLEEKLICFADEFFSKSRLQDEDSVATIRKSLKKFGSDSVKKFDEYCQLFL